MPFSRNHGKVISRQLIIKEIWDDYPGGDEGLNQAVSGLRKLLHDEKKQLIETLPKKGYCFHGILVDNASRAEKKLFQPIYLASAILLILLALVTFRYYQGYHEVYIDKQSREEAIHLSKIDSARQAEQLKIK